MSDLKLLLFKSHLRLDLIDIGVDKIIKKIAEECNNYIENTKTHSKHSVSFREEVYVLFTHLGKHSWCSENFWNMAEKRNTNIISIIRKWITYVQKELHSNLDQMSETELQSKIYKNFITRLYLDSGLICPNPNITQCSSHINGTQLLNCFLQTVEDTIYSFFTIHFEEPKQNNDNSHQYQDVKRSYEKEPEIEYNNYHHKEQTSESEPKYNRSYNEPVDSYNSSSSRNSYDFQDKNDENSASSSRNPYDLQDKNNDIDHAYGINDSNSDVERAVNAGLLLRTNTVPKQTGTTIKLTHYRRKPEQKKTKKKKSKRRKDKYDPLSLNDSSDEDY
jgi:hypothetical protein